MSQLFYIEYKKNNLLPPPKCIELLLDANNNAVVNAANHMQNLF